MNKSLVNAKGSGLLTYLKAFLLKALSMIRLTSISVSMIFSIMLHTFLLFGIALVMPDPYNLSSLARPLLQVVLVNSKSESKPPEADALAQANLDGGGNTAEDRRAKSPLPTISDDQQFTPEQRTKRLALEEESKRMLTRMKSDHTVAPPDIKKRKDNDASNGDDLMQKALEIARLEAQIHKNWDAYQKLPRRTNIGARTKEYRFAQYIEDWRVKVERIGNLNYPEQARRQKVYGSLKLSVSILADGSVEKVEVDKSSGHRILDAAAVHIVKLASPYSALPPNITRDTDILEITRTWSFTSSDRLESE